jgi:hypothetical protein
MVKMSFANLRRRWVGGGGEGEGSGSKKIIKKNKYFFREKEAGK